MLLYGPQEQEDEEEEEETPIEINNSFRQTDGLKVATNQTGFILQAP